LLIVLVPAPRCETLAAPWKTKRDWGSIGERREGGGRGVRKTEETCKERRECKRVVRERRNEAEESAGDARRSQLQKADKPGQIASDSAQGCRSPSSRGRPGPGIVWSDVSRPARKPPKARSQATGAKGGKQPEPCGSESLEGEDQRPRRQLCCGRSRAVAWKGKR
jgi:hypothetical protein